MPEIENVVCRISKRNQSHPAFYAMNGTNSGQGSQLICWSRWLVHHDGRTLANQAAVAAAAWASFNNLATRSLAIAP
jgi:hypothetical protein